MYIRLLNHVDNHFWQCYNELILLQYFLNEALFSTYLSLFLKFILSEKLSSSLWESGVLLFSNFINIVSILFYNFIEFIILLYIFFARYEEYITCLISFSKFSNVSLPFTSAIAIGNFEAFVSLQDLIFSDLNGQSPYRELHVLTYLKILFHDCLCI